MKKLCIIVGHGSGKDRGCYLDLGDRIIWERDVMFDFGIRLCENILENVIFRGKRINLLFLSKEGKETERDIVKQVNKFNADLAVELHCNASTCQASGSEILVAWNKIEPKFQMVNFTSTQRIVYKRGWINGFTKDITRTLNIRNRGIKEKRKGDRGWYFLSKTKCFSIITEPFFLNNKSDYEAYLKNKDKLIMCFTQYISDYIYGG